MPRYRIKYENETDVDISFKDEEFEADDDEEANGRAYDIADKGPYKLYKEKKSSSKYTNCLVWSRVSWV